MRIIAATALTFFALTGSARAETAAPWDAGCFGARPLVPTSLPANAGGVGFVGSVDMVTASLLAADGTELPTELAVSSDEAFLRFDAPLEVGKTYTVRWSDECSGYNTRSFSTTAPIALPTTAGSALIGPRTDNFSGTCDPLGRPVMTIRTAILFAEHPAVTPWFPYADVDLMVNGTKATLPSMDTWGTHADGSAVGYTMLACPGPTAPLQVAVRVRLPDGTTLLTPETTVDIKCPETAPGTCHTVSDGPKTPPTDSGAGEGSDVAADAPQDDTVRAGCHYSAGEAGSIVSATIAALALLGARRRRR